MHSPSVSQLLNFNPEPSRKRTLGFVFAEYLRIRRLRESTIEDYRYRMSILADWMNTPIHEISKEMVLARHQEIRTTRGGRTADLTMTILSALVNWEQDYFDEGPVKLNPVRVLAAAQVRYGARSRKNEYLRPEQIGLWFTAVQKLENRTISDYLTFLLLTGLRRSECASMEWKNVDLEKKTILIQGTKSGVDLLLPLSDYLCEILQDRYSRRKSPYVFHSRFDGVAHLQWPERALKRLEQETGVKVRLHSLRRTFCWIAMSSEVSGDEPAIRACMNAGQKRDALWKHYVNVDETRVRRLMNGVAGYVLGQLNA